MLSSTLASKFDFVMLHVTITTGYYWVYASCGVSSFSTTFSYIGKQLKILGGK